MAATFTMLADGLSFGEWGRVSHDTLIRNQEVPVRWNISTFPLYVGVVVVEAASVCRSSAGG